MVEKFCIVCGAKKGTILHRPGCNVFFDGWVVSEGPVREEVRYFIPMTWSPLIKDVVEYKEANMGMKN